jgi:ribosome maturation factor RimP
VDTGTEASLIARIRAVVERVAISRGLELFELQFRRESHGWVLRIFLDKPGAPVRAGRAGHVGAVEGESVTIEDCRFVSQEVGTLLDVEDVIGPKYTLEVSSPGLDRPLRGPDDFRRFAGCLVKMVATEAVDGQTHLAGRLLGMDGDDVLVQIGREKVKRVPARLVGRARLEVEF